MMGKSEFTFLLCFLNTASTLVAIDYPRFLEKQSGAPTLNIQCPYDAYLFQDSIDESTHLPIGQRSAYGHIDPDIHTYGIKKGFMSTTEGDGTFYYRFMLSGQTSISEGFLLKKGLGLYYHLSKEISFSAQPSWTKFQGLDPQETRRAWELHFLLNMPLY